MAKKITYEIDTKVNTEGSIAQLKALKKQLKETAAGSEEFTKIYNQIDDLEDKIKSAKGVSSDWIDTLESAGGPLGMLGGALNKLKLSTQSFGAALKATGIGLVVAAISGLVAAFSQTEGSLKKLDPLLIGLQKILGGILEVFQPLLDAFLEMALKALPYITKGVGMFYSGLVSLFTLIKEAGAGVGKVLKGVFTLDMDSITEGYEQLKGSWSKTVESYEAGVKRFDEGSKKVTKKEKENAKDLKDIADKALAEKLKRMEASDKLDEASLEKKKAIAMQEAFNDEQKLAVEMEYEQKSYDLKAKALEDKTALYKKDSTEYKALQAELALLDANHIKSVTDNGRALEKIHKDNAQAIVDFEVNLAKRLGELEEEKKNKKYETSKAILDSEKQRLETQLNELLPFSENYEQLLIDIENNSYNQRMLDLDKFLADKKITQEQYDRDVAQATTNHNLTLQNIEKASFEARAKEMFRLANSIGSALASMGKENKKAAKAGIRLQQVATIGDIVLNDASAIRKAYKANPLGFGLPWSAFYLLDMVAGVIAANASANRQIAALDSEGASGGSTAVATPATPPFNGTVNVPAPVIGASEASSTGGLGQTIAGAINQNNSTQRPIQAYVVGDQVTSQQQLDRRIAVAARMGG
jgi:hypothetical protein